MSTSSVSHRPKRFYETASVEESGGAFRVELDARPIRTPAGAELALPTQALAEVVAAEWQGQGETLDIQAMSLTRTANVAIDRTPDTRGAMADEVARYCETDLICHLAEGPSDLVERQKAAWDPVRTWVGKTLGVVLVPVVGIQAAPQPTQSLEAARTHALSLNDFRLTGLAHALGLYGSALLALAVEREHLGAMAAFDSSRIDEDYQATRWGADEEAEEAVTAKRREVIALGTWFGALTG